MADHSLTLSIVLPQLELEAAANYQGPRSTDTSNAFDGAECGGGAIVIKTPPVVAPVAPVAATVDKAIAFPMPDLDTKGRPVSASFIFPHLVQRPGHIDRIVIGGHDVTWFRATDATDTPMQVPGFKTIEPYGYGASDPLLIPRTNSLFEKYGVGELAWLHQGARVQYQRVYNQGTIDELVITDYRGILLAPRPSGQEFVWDVGGEVVSRLDLDLKTAVKIRRVFDLGAMVGYACNTFGIRLFPPGGPDTGLRYPNEGGLSWAGWVSKLGALSRTAATQARALMPRTWGGPVYDFEVKDTTTVHATIFVDGDRVDVSGLVDDLNEQVTTVYGNGVSPDGERWDGTRYPGFGQGKPAPYPFDDNSPFGVGTTDADTDTGDGITIMRKKLVNAGYLAENAASGSTYDQRVADAVDRLKDAAGLAEDGTMTTAAWDALWDLNVTSASLQGARVFPLAEDRRISSWVYSAAGDIIGRNPHHVPGIIRVAVEIDYGVCEQESATHHARALIRAAAGHQWAGTVVLKGISVFAGDVDTSDVSGLTTDDLMPARDLRPGMNVRLAHFDGTAGTVLHLAQAAFQPGIEYETVELTGDTGARDIFDLAQALKRNAESRRNLWREWKASNRGVKPAGNFIAHDRYFGKVYQDIQLAGNRWNQVKVILGQQGNVGRTDIVLQNIAPEHCGALFARPVDPARLTRLVGNPFQVDENGQTAWEHEANDGFFDKRVLLYLYGQGDQPGGYGWKAGYDYNDAGDLVRTSNPLTGRHLDDSSFPYATDPATAPVGYLMIFPRRSCTLRRGRLFWALEDDVT